jgi:hypothetical protein
MAKFKKENKFLVLKREDINIGMAIKEIKEGRSLDRKKPNSYIVVNEDESYAWVVRKLIEISQTNPEGLLILLENLKVEVEDF